MLATKFLLFYSTLKHREDNFKEFMWCMKLALHKILTGHPSLGKKISNNTTLACGNFYSNKAISKSQQLL